MTTELWPSIGLGGDLDSTDLTWAYVVGPVGCGKSTLLRMIARDAATSRRVVALQLQRDNSAGFSACGAMEAFDPDVFRGYVEDLVVDPGTTRPLLIVDGASNGDVQSLDAWLPDTARRGAMQVVCATNSTSPLFSGWGDAAVVVRVDDRQVSGLATGTLTWQRDGRSYAWEVPLAVPTDPPAPLPKKRR